MPQQRIFELEQENERLRRQNAFLQKEVEDATDKAAEVVSLVMGIRRVMPRIGVRKCITC